MYNIALCDDEEKVLDQIEDYLAGYQDVKRAFEYEIQRFVSAEDLLKRIKEEQFAPDLLLLDIYLSGKTGIEAAEKIREQGLCMPIVFLTISTEHALKAYGVDAIQYLVKPLDKKRFFHAMDSAVGQLEKTQERYVVLKIPGGVRQIQPNEIVYCESQKNYQILYLTAGEYRVRMTAGKLWEVLEHFPQFGRCGRSYILNLHHIISMEREEILMDDGTMIYIPRNKAAEFKKIYFSYYFDSKDEAGRTNS